MPLPLPSYLDATSTLKGPWEWSHFGICLHINLASGTHLQKLDSQVIMEAFLSWFVVGMFKSIKSRPRLFPDGHPNSNQFRLANPITQKYSTSALFLDCNSTFSGWYTNLCWSTPNSCWSIWGHWQTQNVQFLVQNHPIFRIQMFEPSLYFRV